MKKVNVKKLILPNIPYVFIALLATKVSEAVRLAPGSDASAKLLNIMTGLNTAFHSLVPSFHPIDLCMGVAAAIAIRLAVYIKGKNAKKFRKNLEYGSARWGTAEDIKPYVDPAFENNIILTQTERLTEAHRLHMKIAVHAVSRDGIIECIKAGIDTIEHGPDIPDEYLDVMKEKGLTLVPTLAIYKILSEGVGVLSDFMVERSLKVTNQQRDTFGRARAKGVRIALGTDAGSPLFGPHPVAFKEMHMMNLYGMSKEEVVTSATLTAAEVLGMEHEIGSVEPGKLADLLVLETNPYEDLDAFTKHLVSVYKEGMLV